MSIFKPFLLFFAAFFLIGLACPFTGGADPTATPVVPVQQEEVVVEPPVVEEPTATFTPTATLMPTRTPTEEPPAVTEEPEEEPEEEIVYEPLAYFTEEFEGDQSSWSWFMMSGDEDKMDLYTQDGYLVFDLRGEQQYVYYLYDEYTYENVYVEMQAENLGKNTNNVSLICNYTDRQGWYEFSVSNGGEYFIWIYSEIDGGYAELASGGSTRVRMGRDVNTYAASCEGNKLKLYINGYLEREYTDTRYNLREGLVGIGVSSFNVLPILIEVDYVTISQP